MQSDKQAWVRVELTPASLVSSYTIYVMQLEPKDDLVSSSIGTVKFVDPVRCVDLLRPIADPLMLIIMRGKSIADVGDIQPVSRMNPHTGTIVWLYATQLSRTQLVSISESEEWKQNSTKKEARLMGKLIRQLATEPITDSA